jgi:ornithine cyclodeaminase
MPAIRPGGLATVKLVNVKHGEREQLQSHLLAFDSDGRLLAVIDAHALTARRTAAASVLAAQALGAADARRLAVLGAGRQARAQIEAFASAFPLNTVTIWARRPEAAESLARYAQAFVPEVRAAETPSGAVRGTELVTSATPSRAPLIRSADIQSGAHIDLVGGFRRDMREAEDALFARATVIADSPAALEEAGDLSQPIARGLIDATDVHMLADLLAGSPIPERGDVTIFKSVGHAAEDLVAAELLLGRLGLADELTPTSERWPRTARASA